MADHNEKYFSGQSPKSGQSADQNKQADDFSTDESPSSSSTSPGGESYDSCGCGSGQQQGRKAFHPWEPETWECEETDACDASSGSSSTRDASPSELDAYDRQGEDDMPPAPTGPRAEANSAESLALYDDLVRSQRPEGDASEQSDTDEPAVSESGSSTPMQWTLVDLAGKSCDVPGCDPESCDSDECEDERSERRESRESDYATAGQSATSDSDSDVLASEPGPAPEPMFNAFGFGQDQAEGQTEMKRGGKRVSKKAAAAMAGLGLTPDPSAADAGKPKKGAKKAAAKKGAKAKKPAAKKATAKKGAKKTTAKKGGKKPAKKPTTPRGKKAAGSSLPLVTDPTLPTEKAA